MSLKILRKKRHTTNLGTMPLTRAAGAAPEEGTLSAADSAALADLT